MLKRTLFDGLVRLILFLKEIF